jgi:hypothetical protein
MFRNDEQACAAIRALLGTLKLDYLWTAAGPTDEASDLLAQNGGPLSSGERVLLLSAWALWNGRGNLCLSDVIDYLDRERTRALCGLMLAIQQGAAAVDRWLEGHPAPYCKAVGN